MEDPTPAGTGISGVVLAAGGGRRSGAPKALRKAPDGTPWLALAVRRLGDAGCDPVIVVLGAAAEMAFPLIPHADAPRIDVVVARDWSLGIHASLRAALAACARTTRDAAMVTLVDLPDMPGEVARRLVAAGPVHRGMLRRAVYNGRPGHPVLMGRDHWGPIAATVDRDRGAAAYLDAHGVEQIDCGDIWDGNDVDF